MELIKKAKITLAVGVGVAALFGVASFATFSVHQGQQIAYAKAAATQQALVPQDMDDCLVKFENFAGNHQTDIQSVCWDMIEGGDDTFWPHPDHPAD